MKVDPAVQARYGLVVVDTNVLLSAALSSGGVPAVLVDRLLEIGKLVFSPATFAELEARIWLPKFDRYLPIERRRRIVLQAHAAAVWTDIPADLAARAFSRDPRTICSFRPPSRRARRGWSRAITICSAYTRWTPCTS